MPTCSKRTKMYIGRAGFLMYPQPIALENTRLQSVRGFAKILRRRPTQIQLDMALPVGTRVNALKLELLSKRPRRPIQQNPLTQSNRPGEANPVAQAQSGISGAVAYDKDTPSACTGGEDVSSTPYCNSDHYAIPGTGCLEGTKTYTRRG
jgi:hypothetical protein